MESIMKRLVFLVLLASLVWSGCTKTEGTSAVYKGVVIYDICGNVVVQSVGTDKIGQASWVDVNNAERPTYRHVFRVANPCQFGVHSFGDTISFRIVAPQSQHCNQCQVSLVMPDTSYPIHVEN